MKARSNRGLCSFPCSVRREGPHSLRRASLSAIDTEARAVGVAGFPAAGVISHSMVRCSRSGGSRTFPPERKNRPQENWTSQRSVAALQPKTDCRERNPSTKPGHPCMDSLFVTSLQDAKNFRRTKDLFECKMMLVLGLSAGSAQRPPARGIIDCGSRRAGKNELQSRIRPFQPGCLQGRNGFPSSFRHPDLMSTFGRAPARGKQYKTKCSSKIRAICTPPVEPPKGFALTTNRVVHGRQSHGNRRRSAREARAMRHLPDGLGRKNGTGDPHAIAAGGIPKNPARPVLSSVEPRSNSREGNCSSLCGFQSWGTAPVSQRGRNAVLRHGSLVPEWKKP